MTRKLLKDLLLRFVLGGLAVAACYILLVFVPWKAMAGIFAAFPAVMIAAVIMAGHFEGSKQAANVAFGATAGMLGCALCVLTASLVLHYLQNWSMAIIIALIIWLISSIIFINIINRYSLKGSQH